MRIGGLRSTVKLVKPGAGRRIPRCLRLRRRTRPSGPTCKPYRSVPERTNCSPGTRSESMHRCAVMIVLVLFFSSLCSLGTASLPLARGDAKVRASLEKRDFGKTLDGKTVNLYVLTNARG